MLLGEIQHILEEWAPRELAWERDSVGLEIGSARQDVRRILLALDVTDEVIREAHRKRAGLVISHHPVLYRPLKSLTPDDRAARILLECARVGIALYAMHTNLDFTEGGVSMAMASELGLVDTRVLKGQEGILKKIVVFVPSDHAERLMSRMAAAGAGRIGNYGECSFSSDGRGTFRPLKGAKPAIGSTGKLERVGETRLEMIVPIWNLRKAVEGMLEAHPYEEVAYDVYDLATTSPRYGSGAIGTLPRPVRTAEFLKHVQRSLGTPVLRHSGGDTRRHIRCVAVCGGNGSELAGTARESGADALVTGDVSYHRFQEERILVVDAGHYETERPVLKILAARLRDAFSSRRARVRVSISTTSRTSVHYFIP